MIYDPLMAAFGSKTPQFIIRNVVFDDAQNDLHYSIMMWASSMSESGQGVDLYNKYQNTFDSVINSFVFSANPKIFNEAAGANKSVVVKITDVKLNISKLIDENGNVEMIRITTNISLYNPKAEALILSKLNYRGIAVYKKDGNLRILKPLPLGVNGFYYQIIQPMDTYKYSDERDILDNDTIQYFTGNELKYIKIKGSVSLIPNETSPKPVTFDTSFNAMITMTNGSVESIEVVQY